MGGAIMSAGDPPAGQASPQRYVLDSTSFRLYDGTSTNYGAPSGAGVTFEAKNDGTIFLSKGVTIQSALAGVARLVIDMTGANPMLSINDGIVDRVQIGNLLSNGVSPAQWGMRVNDSSGTPIFDSLGLIGVMKLLGTADTGVLNTDYTASTTTIPGSTFTFTLARTATVLTFFTLIANITNATTPSGYARPYSMVNGVASDKGVIGRIAGGVSDGEYSTMTMLRVDTLAGGASITVQIRVDCDTSTSVGVYRGMIYSFLMGG